MMRASTTTHSAGAPPAAAAAAALARPGGRAAAPLARRAPRRARAPAPPARPTAFGGAAAAPTDAAAAPAAGKDGIEVKLIGVGGRGAAAVARLAARLGGADAGVTAWCLDADRGALEAASGVASTLLLPADAGGEAPLSAADLARVVGRAAASDAGGRGNVGAGDGGVALLLAPAAGGPGGAALLAQLAAALRGAGHFTVAALTAPFGFEGAAKAKAAAVAVAALEARAHLVAVTEADVLLQAFGAASLTVAEATEIADRSLEHTARAVLQAVRAKELLKSSGGGLAWHGADLRRFRRLLAPPLQQLLTCPGTAVLGRGAAALPASSAAAMGPRAALMHLASDAVAAAGESPFLDTALPAASGVLAVLTLPPGGLGALGGAASGAERARDERLAGQAAAGALRSITGAGCDDFVLCIEEREAGEGGGGEAPDTIQVEATLLVLRRPGAGAAARPAAGAGALAELGGAAMAPGVVAARPAAAAPAPAAPQRAAPAEGGSTSKRLPSSSWAMMSAMAGGGSGGGARAVPAPRAPSPAPRPAQQQQQPARARPNPLLTGGAAPRAPPPERVAVSGFASAAPSPAARDTTLPAATDPDAAGGAPPPPDRAAVTVGDYLVESLTATSLDLPPAAARWRQSQRAAGAAEGRRLVVWEVDASELSEEEEKEAAGGGGLRGFLLGGGRRAPAPARPDIRERMAGVLAQDREDTGAWGPPDGAVRR